MATTRIPNDATIAKIADLKMELRIDTDDELAHLKRLARAAQLACEGYIGQDILPANYTEYEEENGERVVLRSFASAGIASDPSLVPTDIVQAILLLAVHLYENRDSDTQIPVSVEFLLQPYKVYA